MAATSRSSRASRTASRRLFRSGSGASGRGGHAAPAGQQTKTQRTRALGHNHLMRDGDDLLATSLCGESAPHRACLESRPGRGQGQPPSAALNIEEPHAHRAHTHSDDHRVTRSRSPGGYARVRPGRPHGTEIEGSRDEFPTARCHPPTRPSRITVPNFVRPEHALPSLPDSRQVSPWRLPILMTLIRKLPVPSRRYRGCGPVSPGGRGGDPGWLIGPRPFASGPATSGDVHPAPERSSSQVMALASLSDG